MSNKNDDLEKQIESKTHELCELLKKNKWNLTEWSIREIAIHFSDSYYEAIGLLSEAMMTLKQINDDSADTEEICPGCGKPHNDDPEPPALRKSKIHSDDDVLAMAG